MNTQVCCFVLLNIKVAYRVIGLISGVFANGPEGRVSIPGRVISKTQKMVLDASLLNTAL